MSGLFTVPELAIGVGLSEAASAAFEPKVEVPKQSAWAKNPQRVPDLGLIAELIAGGKVTLLDGKNMANRLGFSDGTMESLVWLAQNRLDFPLMLRLWRRFGAFDAGDDAALDALFDKTIAHEQLDWDYRPWLRRLKTAELVGLGDIAMGIVRSALPAPSYVPVPAPTTGLSVQRFPQVDIDPEKLAAALGFDKDMLQLMVARSGLSLAPGLAATALFRKLINANDYLLAIAEGDLRTEWADTLKDAMRAVPTPGEAIQYQLRGFTDRAGRLDLTDLHGMSHPHSDVLYDVAGRAPAVRQVYLGLARGAKYPSTYDDVPEPYRSAIERSDIRPEFADIVYHTRFGEPSAFVVRALLRDGAITADRGATILENSGIPPDLATLVADFYAASGGTTADPHVTKAQNQLWTTTHRSYIAEETDDATATAALQAAGVAAGSIPAVLSLWGEERSLIRRQLTPAQVKKAYTSQTLNPATGVAWTEADALAALLARGYDDADARTLLFE